ncbi:hypothetical protein [Candidatus Avelusimicrobium sp.]
MKHLLLTFLLFATTLAQAAVFASKDGRFNMELPPAWTQPSKPTAGAVLSVVKEKARIDIKPISDCKDEACLEKKVQKDLADVKKKKMEVIRNDYTGEEIKRIDFSTGEPFFYIHFFSGKNDFSSGYFLIGKNAYSVLAKDLTYAQTDLIFSFISPVQDATQPDGSLEMDLTDERAYSIDALPAVTEESLLSKNELQAVEIKPAEQVQLSQAPAVKAKTKTPRTLVTRNMPPYIKQLGHGFDVIVILLFVYIFLQGGALLVRFFVRKKDSAAQVNPNSPYPIKFRRLYGTPSLIFRARDNQGNVLISLSGRWDSLFLFGGIILVVGAVFVMAFTGLLESTQIVKLSAFTYNTIYSAVSLIIPLGFVVFICGLLWSQLVLRQFALYDAKGHKAVYIMQRGFGLKKECYLAYFAKSKEVLLLERKRFSLLRKWQMLDKQRQVLAHITEEGTAKALVRKITGHLWGFLRASYHIEGPMQSSGRLENAGRAFDYFTCNIDKPQALSARDLLVASLIINIRDRDKWYPWF